MTGTRSDPGSIGSQYNSYWVCGRGAHGDVGLIQQALPMSRAASPAATRKPYIPSLFRPGAMKATVVL